jgi:hypothetical protein
LTLAGFEGEPRESCSEKERHDCVEQEVDAKGLQPSDEVVWRVLVREEQGDEDGDDADGDVGAAEVGGSFAEGGGLFAEVAQKCGEHGDGAGETE